MPLHIKKNLHDLMISARKRLDNELTTKGKKVSMTPGSVVRLLIACINAELEEVYDTIEEAHLMSFLSTSSDEFLDMIGEIVNCKRDGLVDSSYKKKISQQVTVLERANELAIRTAALSVPGVADIEMKPFTHGSGSFSIFVLSEQSAPIEGVIENCKEKVSEVVAYGTRFNVEGPVNIGIEIKIKVLLKNGVEDKEPIIEEVKNNVREYIDSLGLAEPFIINEVIQASMATSDDIHDIKIHELRVDNVRKLISNQSCKWNERFVESTLPGAIDIS